MAALQDEAALGRAFAVPSRTIGRIGARRLASSNALS
jgi:hypothetical protein